MQQQWPVFVRQWRRLQPRSTLLRRHLCLRFDLVPDRLLHRRKDVYRAADRGELRHQRRCVHGL